MQLRSRRAPTTALFALMAALACGAGDVPMSVGVECVSLVSVTPSSATLAVGATTTLSASLTATTCTSQPTIAWHSSATNIATVSNTGIVTGVAPGTTIIGAEAGGVTGTAAITVVAPVVTVLLTAPATTLLTGGRLQATAQAEDAAGNLLSFRTFTWQTSNETVATVSASGLITGVAAGTATITATSEGRSAQLAITVAGELTVTSITPAANATSVSIESLIVIQLSSGLTGGFLDVRVTAGGTDVAGGLSFDAQGAVTFTPAQLLTEFNTVYTVTVTTGLLSNYPKPGAQSVTTFTTAFWDPAYYYRITNQSLGATQSLDTFSGSLQCIMSTPGQAWYFTTVSGGFTMKSAFQGEARVLEGGDGTGPCVLSAPPIATGQIWTVPVAVAQFPNTYRLQNVFFGANRSLDASVTIGGVASPRMLATANTAAQAWSFTRLVHR
jgi:hypothetical protein